jgi:hypothetical protein
MTLVSPHPARPLRTETLHLDTQGRIVLARWGPLDAESRGAIARQTELLAPAKLALSTHGEPELLAEVLRSCETDAPKLARNALDVARAWLSGEAPAIAASDEEDLASALAELPAAWAWERGEGDDYRVHATAFGESVRLAVSAVAGGAQVIARSALATSEPGTRPALVRFALDANRRLRLARIGLNDMDDETTAVTWDAVTPTGVDLSRALPAAVEAVVRGHAATRRSLRALCHAPVARAYLDSREAAPRRRRSIPRA